MPVLMQKTDEYVKKCSLFFIGILIAFYSIMSQAEMHLYAQGGHGFGVRPTDRPITNWPQLLETWLKTIGMIS